MSDARSIQSPDLIYEQRSLNARAPHAPFQLIEDENGPFSSLSPDLPWCYLRAITCTNSMHTSFRSGKCFWDAGRALVCHVMKRRMHRTKIRTSWLPHAFHRRSGPADSRVHAAHRPWWRSTHRPRHRGLRCRRRPVSYTHLRAHET